mgnify:FL=1
MSYIDVETSTASGLPIELYEFARGGVQYWRFNNTDKDVVRSGLTYKTMQVERGKVQQTSDPDKNDLTLTFPRSLQFAVSMLRHSPEEVTTLTIYRGHIGGGDDFITYWKGRILAVSADGNAITMSLESIFTSMQRYGLRARFEYGCRHSLYAAACGVSEADYKFIGAVSNLDGLSMEIYGANAQPNGWYTGGVFHWGGHGTRMIASHVGNQLVLNRPLPGLRNGVTVNIYPGCDRRLGTCINKFNNVANFGGFPWIPSRNPFEGSFI